MTTNESNGSVNDEGVEEAIERVWMSMLPLPRNQGWSQARRREELVAATTALVEAVRRDERFRVELLLVEAVARVGGLTARLGDRADKDDREHVESLIERLRALREEVVQ